MHHHVGGLARFDCGRIEFANTARKLSAVQITKAHHIARGKIALAPRHAGRHARPGGADQLSAAASAASSDASANSWPSASARCGTAFWLAVTISAIDP